MGVAVWVLEPLGAISYENLNGSIGSEVNERNYNITEIQTRFMHKTGASLTEMEAVYMQRLYE